MRLVEIGLVDDAGRLLVEGADDDVPVTVGEALLKLGGRAEEQVDEHVEARLHQPRQGFLQAQLRARIDSIRHADLQPPGNAATRRADARLEILDVAEELARGIIGGLAKIGQPEAVAPAQAELPPDALFQFGQVGAERGLRKVQRDLRLREAPRIRQDHEDAQQPQVDVVEPAQLVVLLLTLTFLEASFQKL
jgi:hypothetical protein